MATHTKKYIYPTSSFPPFSLLLGTLVSNPQSPTTDALSIQSPVWGQDCSRRDDISITTSGLARLTPAQKKSIAHVFLGSAAAADQGKLSIKAHHGFIYTLWTPKEWFNKLCSQASVRTWLEDTYASKKQAYLLVGCKTIVDAHFVAHERRASATQSRQEEEEWEFPGERIYALELRKVEMRFFERTEGEVLIWGPVWESHSKVLGGEGEMEAVEASLEGFVGDEE